MRCSVRSSPAPDENALNAGLERSRARASDRRSLQGAINAGTKLEKLLRPRPAWNRRRTPHLSHDMTTRRGAAFSRKETRRAARVRCAARRRCGSKGSPRFERAFRAERYSTRKPFASTACASSSGPVPHSSAPQLHARARQGPSEDLAEPSGNAKVQTRNWRCRRAPLCRPRGRAHAARDQPRLPRGICRICLLLLLRLAGRGFFHCRAQKCKEPL